MRPLVPTSLTTGRGRTVLPPVLLAIGLCLGLALLACLGGETRPLPERAEEQKPLCQKAGPEGLVRLASLGESPNRPLFRQPQPGRGRLPPVTQALPRAVRERQEALIATAAQVMRASQAPISGGYLADRPPLVTRPLRGPPARA
jgi:hypothetical protein